MRTIGVVTTSRADWGLLRPVVRAIATDPAMEPRIIASGAHLSAAHGMTARAIETDGFAIACRVPLDLSHDTPAAIGQIMGEAIRGFAETLDRLQPEILLTLGDRYEMHAAALAALPQKIPVAHIHGGEVTEGAIDDALRHCMTKLSHLHFVATEEYRRRVIQLGEEPWRVHVTGAPGLDNLRTVTPLSCGEIAARLSLHLPGRFLLVTMHPVTLEFEDTERHIAELLSALDAMGLPVVFTRANADTHGQLINAKIDEHVATHSDAQVVDSLGTQGYLSVMGLALAMVGNSSSGLIEAPSFELPVVNVGNRQRGRVRGANVIDCPCESREILGAIRLALKEEFRESLRGMPNPHGDGHASEKILRVLRDVALDRDLIMKRFHDLPAEKT